METIPVAELGDQFAAMTKRDPKHEDRLDRYRRAAAGYLRWPVATTEDGAQLAAVATELGYTQQQVEADLAALRSLQELWTRTLPEIAELEEQIHAINPELQAARVRADQLEAEHRRLVDNRQLLRQIAARTITETTSHHPHLIERRGTQAVPIFGGTGCFRESDTGTSQKKERKTNGR